MIFYTLYTIQSLSLITFASTLRLKKNALNNKTETAADKTFYKMKTNHVSVPCLTLYKT